MDICRLCSDQNRDSQTLCVVEDIRDVMAIENTLQFKENTMFWVVFHP